MDRDKALTEAMGEVWSDAMCQCNRCGGSGNCCNPVYSGWRGFGKLWEWAIEQEWWNNFQDMAIGGAEIYEDESVRRYIFMEFINPDTFASAIDKYLKERKQDADKNSPKRQAEVV